MITRLRAENFKSWKDTGDLRLAPLTGLFGTNSSGKSSILQVLLMLKQTVESSDQRRVLFLGDDTSLVDLGTFADVIHNHDESLPLEVGLACQDSNGEVRLDVAIKEVDDYLRLARFEYTSANKIIRVKEGPDGYTRSRDEGPESPTASPFSLGLLDDPSWNIHLSLERTFYLGPLRQRPQRSYRWGGNEPFGVGKDGSEAVQALLGTRHGLRTTGSVREWLKRMNLIESLRIERIAPNRKDYEIRLCKNAGGAEVLLPDVGFGVSQILPILVLCYYAEEGSTLILEQPELHLHPAAQSELGDLLIEVVKDRKLQIIVESHSEHLLRRIQRRVAEGAFEAKDTALYFCEMDNGESKATELQIGDDGFIKNWPNDFFGDEMGELSALTEAAIKRRLAHAK